MKKILLVHGPNLNLLGKRDSKHYGDLTLSGLENLVKEKAQIEDLEVMCFQSNHEGGIIDWLQINSPSAVGHIINSGPFAPYSYALHDCLVDTNLPCVEVHLSDIENREVWRKNSVIAAACVAKIFGKKESGYLEALEILIKKI